MVKMTGAIMDLSHDQVAGAAFIVKPSRCLRVVIMRLQSIGG